MAGPDISSNGGGSNYQCLPDDPEYNSYRVPVTMSSLRNIVYIESPNINGVNLHVQRVPCIACESQRRVTLIMIPGKIRCPTSDWTLEYRGYVMSEYEHLEGDHGNFEGAKSCGRGNYVCVDEASDPLSIKPKTYGGVLHTVSALCTGDDALYCSPPYKNDDSALSCAVCSK